MSRRKRKGRNVSGVLLLDKPLGLSSNKALQQVKHLYQAAKAGHTGSLDPLATGLLPVCFGEATKFTSFLLDADKAYHAVCRLGQTTSTGDAEGDITESKPVAGIKQQAIEAVLKQFTGTIHQIPPMHSALKQDGKRLYTLARKGIEVERKPRRVEVFSNRCVSFEGDELVIEVACSKGTYIRTLVEDIGAELGCGAHITALKRRQVGIYQLEQAYTADDIQAAAERGYEALDSLLLPPDSALHEWPQITLNPALSDYILQGQAVQVPKAPTGGLLRLYEVAGGDSRFIGIGHVLSDGRVAPKRLIDREKR